MSQTPVAPNDGRLRWIADRGRAFIADGGLQAVFVLELASGERAVASR